MVLTQVRFSSLTFERRRNLPVEFSMHFWCCSHQYKDDVLSKETVWPIPQVLFFTAVILTRPEVAVLTLCRRKPSSTGLGNSQSNLGCLFNIAVSVFVELLDFFPPIYVLCFYCLGDGFWAESVGLPEYFLGCLHLLCKSLAISCFSQLWRHVGLNYITCNCCGSIGILSTCNSVHSRVS